MYELPAPPADSGEWCIRCGWHRAEQPSGLCPVCIDSILGPAAGHTERDVDDALKLEGFVTDSAGSTVRATGPAWRELLELTGETDV